MVSSIWGGFLRNNEVGPGIYVDFLPDVLTTGAYQAALLASIVGTGLESIPLAIDQLKKVPPQKNSSSPSDPRWARFRSGSRNVSVKNRHPHRSASGC